MEREITFETEFQVPFGFLIPLPYIKILIEKNWLLQFVCILKPLSLNFASSVKKYKLL